jgi:hypothetical protein
MAEEKARLPDVSRSTHDNLNLFKIEYNKAHQNDRLKTIGAAIDKLIEIAGQCDQAMEATNRLKAALKPIKENESSTDEDAVWYLIRFHDFYMDFFDAVREPGRVRISKDDNEYSMLIELKDPYCGHILKFTNLEFGEYEELEKQAKKVPALEKRIQDLETRIIELEDALTETINEKVE